METLLTPRVSPHDTYCSPGTYSRAVVDDVDGLMSSTATAASEEVYAASGEDHDFDGAEVTNKSNGLRVLPRTITISRSDAVGSYTTDDITISGTFNGEAVTETITPPDADGNDVLRGTQLFDDPTAVTITFPAQVDANGAFTIGVADIGAPGNSVFRAVRAHSAGDVVLAGDDGALDVVPFGTGIEIVATKRVKATGGGGTTGVGVTVYL